MASEGRIPNWLQHNWGAKVMAVLLAVVTWFGIDHTISNKELIPDIPLVIRTGEGFAVLNRSVDAVDITFRGSREDIQRLKRGDVTVEIAAGDEAGVSRIELRADHVKASGGSRVVSLDPEIVEVVLDREGEKKVPVKPATEDTLPDGYVLEKLTPNPTNVTIRGPVSQIQAVEVIRTRPISLKGRNGTFRERIALAPPSDIWDTRMDPEKVMVEAVILEHTSEKLIESVPVSALTGSGTRQSVQIKPAHVNITLKGGEELLKKMDVTRISAYVDSSGLEPGLESVLPVKVILDSRIAVDSIVPDVVTVEISTR